jgi:hypothetical protein
MCILLFSLSVFGDYEKSCNTIDVGGGQYELLSSIGQPDVVWSSGGDYELQGGFLPGGPLRFVDLEHSARFAEHWLDEPAYNWKNFRDINIKYIHPRDKQWSR